MHRNIFLPVSLPRSIVASLLIAASLAALTASTAHAQRKRRIAILSFELGDQATAVGRQHNLPSLSRDLLNKLTLKLVRDGKFEVVERAALQDIITQQNLSNSDRFNTADAAKIGKLAGVDDVIIASLTDLSYSDKSNKPGIKILMKDYVDHTVTIGVTTSARVIDVNTAGTPATGEGKASAQDTEKGLKGVSGDTGFGNNLLGKATEEAIAIMVAQLESSTTLGDLAAAPRAPYSGTVADVNGKTIIFSFEGKGTVKVGDALQVIREGRKITDPKNPKRVLRVMHDTIGPAAVIEVDAASSTATANYTGQGTPRLGDEVSYKPE